MDEVPVHAEGSVTQILALCDELEELWRKLPPPPYREERQDDTACMSTYVLVANDGTRVACLDCNAHEGDCAWMPEEVAAFLSRTAYVLPRLMAELRGRLAEEGSMTPEERAHRLALALHYECGECGYHVAVNEDGLCTACGATALIQVCRCARGREDK